MLEVLLIRHGKSSWSDRSCSDMERRLKKRGLKEAMQLGKKLMTQSLVPDYMLVSSALRAKETAIQLQSSFQCKMEIEPSLYSTTVTDLEAILQRQNDAVKRIAIVGHNPTLTEAVNKAGSPLANLPTASAALCKFSALQQWNEFSFSIAGVVTIITPKIEGAPQ